MDASPRKAREVFLAAIRVPAEESEAYLREACGDDKDLYRRVSELVQAQAEIGSFHEAPPLTADELITESPGAVIGLYKLLEQIGEGGMGSVWMAQQTEPVKRLVALKLIKAGMDSKQVIARFEAERQALAMMEHPNIARVLDAGATDAGRPYFVMEVVKGVPITRYCDEARLTPRQRLDLFVPVCQAIQHAHQKGIIHRDLKPSNVLVALYDGKPVPKVIDFGIAKAAGQQLTDHTLVTGFGVLVGTLEYMSPEQAEVNQLDIDTRSDIYSLGVLLYELLTGTPPFSRKELEKAGVLEMLRVIREQEPSKPSTRLSTAEGLPTLAANRGTEPAKLTSLVRGELDWIVMKALEKDRNRRYDTANAFALDVQRYLADEPVLACPPSGWYRLRKFARRNRGRITLTAALALAALITVGTLGWALWDRAARQREIELERAVREKEIQLEREGVLEQAERFRDQEQWPQARAAVAQARELFSTSSTVAQQRRLEQVVRDLALVARVERNRIDQIPMGQFTPYPFKYLPQHVREYADAFREYGIDVLGADVAAVANHIRTSAIRNALVAALDDWMWGYQYAKPPKDGPVNPARARIPTPRELETRQQIVVVYERLRGIADLAMPNELQRRIRDPRVQMDRRALEELADQPPVLLLPPSTVLLLVRLLYVAGAVDKSELLLFGLQQRRPDDFAVNYQLARMIAYSVRGRVERVEQAIGFMRAAVALRPDNGTLHLNLGVLLRTARRPEQAIVELRRGHELQPSRESAQQLTMGLNEHGLACRKSGQWEKAIASFEEASRLTPKTLEQAGPHRQLAWLLSTCPDPNLRNPALALQSAGIAVQSKTPDGESWSALGVARYRAGDWNGAIAALERACELRSGGGAAEHFFLAMAHLKRGGKGQARQFFDQAVRWMKDKENVINANPVQKEELGRFRAEAAELLGI